MATVLTKIDENVRNAEYVEALRLCGENNLSYLGILIAKALIELEIVKKTPKFYKELAKLQTQTESKTPQSILQDMIESGTVKIVKKSETGEISSEVQQTGIVEAKNITVSQDKETPKTPEIPEETPEIPEETFTKTPEPSPEVPETVSVDKDEIKIKLLGNWTTSEELSKLWNKMSQGNYTWNKLRLVWEEEPDFFVVINKPPPGEEEIDKSKTILFHMEPHMNKDKSWGEWGNPKRKEFLEVCDHATTFNNNEWHLGKTYTELLEEEIVKDPELDKVLSTVLSAKYSDPGHIKRVDFVKFLDTLENMTVHVYGNNKWEYKNYKGSPPPYCKEEALFPYKYTFNMENHCIDNYYTEKLIDAILSESLCFYSGPFNIRDLIDSKAYVQLGLHSFERDAATIEKAMKEDWWSQRIEVIRKEKKRILNELQFFPRVEKILEKHGKLEN